MSNVINLSKGDRINLSKNNPGLKIAAAAIGWKAQQFDDAPFDLDVTAFLLGEDGKVVGLEAKNVIFYNNPVHESQSVKHSGDNRTGSADGSDGETITIDLTKVPANVAKVQIAVTIDAAEARRQNFGQVRNASCHVYDAETKADVCRYDLTEDYSGKTAVVIGEFYKAGGDWRFAAVGGGYNGGLAALCQGVGLQA